jgi:aspartyl protease family protein
VNDGDQALNFIYLLGCLVLVGSALLVRRAPIGQTIKMALAWVLIFAAGFAIFTLRDDFRALGGRMMAEVSGEAAQQTKGGQLRIRAGEGGHFWINGEINGRAVRFLVDSGATVTMLSRATADGAGVAAGSGIGVLVDTANGSMMVDRGRVASLKAGPIERTDFPVYISPTPGDTNVLGMNFLSSLRAWGVEGNILVLTP